MKMDQTECSKTTAYKIQTPRNYPEENIQHYTTRQKLEIKNYTVIQEVEHDPCWDLMHPDLERLNSISTGFYTQDVQNLLNSF
jgi:hypothetical protein